MRFLPSRDVVTKAMGDIGKAHRCAGMRFGHHNRFAGGAASGLDGA
jgi:hypothetical protein